MNYVVFDTETTSLDKPFCYNIGYIIVNESNEVLVKRDFVVEQVWHNLPLFQSAYYADKRPLYVSRMKARTTTMDKYGYICQQMIRDFKAFEIEHAYAYNSAFDEKVFAYNCEWFKCANPFDNIAIHDIRGYVHEFLIDNEFIEWCEANGYFTESGNYSTTAETIYRFLYTSDFVEEHTALADSIIENEILLATIDNGADYGKDYKVKRSIERKVEKTLTVKSREGTSHSFKYEKIRINKDKTEISLK